MKVWAVMRLWEAGTIAIFTTEDKANNFRDAYQKKYTYDSVYVDEFELDDDGKLKRK